ncbi:MAG: hypothetical protein RMI89_04240 [Gloeomargarita sp. SKYBB_i_bin120]|nr:hypothetical protein [Gloeomargarita sp. SKYB120]MDW8177729.1 hypothetical protein [Gloeomargarita sp. SKYBB_i_bin120]
MTHPESSPAGPDKESFIYPRATYHGEFTPQKFLFNANLQEFAHRVGIICSLETGGKITTEEAYREIKKLWKRLKESWKNLGFQDEPDNH